MSVEHTLHMPHYHMLMGPTLVMVVTTKHHYLYVLVGHVNLWVKIVISYYGGSGSYIMEQRSRSGGVMGGRGGGGVRRLVCEGEDDDCTEQRQEKISSTRYVWKIGLVPANCVFHPRIICYFKNNSNVSGVLVDRMDESDDDERGETFFDPPPDGWSSSSPGDILGRASSLKISYE